MHNNEEKVNMSHKSLAYWGDQTIKVIREIEDMLKEYYGEEEYLFLRNAIIHLMSLKGWAWHNSLSARKSAYERALRLKQEVEKRIGAVHPDEEL
ncbi:MAG: hypothetical protein QW733_03900 [Desulfurococcaceae archaeon]